jgi:PE family
MSCAITMPELLAAAAGRPEVIGLGRQCGQCDHWLSTTGVVPAAAGQVSAVTAAGSATYAHLYQAISVEAVSPLALKSRVSTMRKTAQSPLLSTIADKRDTAVSLAVSSVSTK